MEYAAAFVVIVIFVAAAVILDKWMRRRGI